MGFPHPPRRKGAALSATSPPSQSLSPGFPLLSLTQPAIIPIVPIIPNPLIIPIVPIVPFTPPSHLNFRLVNKTYLLDSQYQLQNIYNITYTKTYKPLYNQTTKSENPGKHSERKYNQIHLTPKPTKKFHLGSFGEFFKPTRPHIKLFHFQLQMFHPDFSSGR